MDIKEEAILGDTLEDHWYYRAKRLAMDTMLEGVTANTVLDVGAGSSIFSKHLLDKGVSSAICVDAAYAVPDRSDVFHGKPIRYLREVKDGNADLVLLMDVLEHVDDDVELIRTSLKGATSGAYVLITVPAFQALFSAHDRFLEHKRRYTVHSLEDAVAAAGLEILSTRYFFGFVLPIAAMLRVLQRDAPAKSSLAAHSPLVNALLTLVHRAELPLFKFNRLGGLSVFCLARVP
ncbi:MAG TPA: class I SAM-dependent methyltransferase [Rhizomicrobium sp.]|jgi:hypothetical protein